MTQIADLPFQQGIAFGAQRAGGASAANATRSPATADFVGLGDAVRRVSRASVAPAGASGLSPSTPSQTTDRLPRKGQTLDVRA